MPHKTTPSLIFLLFFLGSFSALAQHSELKTDSLGLEIYDFGARHYQTDHCFCPWLVKTDSAQRQQWDPARMQNSPYQWAEPSKIIVLDSLHITDSLLQKWIDAGFVKPVIKKKEVKPVL